MSEYNAQLKREEEAAQAALSGVLAGGGASRPASSRHGIATPGYNLTLTLTLALTATPTLPNPNQASPRPARAEGRASRVVSPPP